MHRYALFATAHGSAAIAWNDADAVVALRLPAARVDEARSAVLRRVSDAVESAATPSIARLIGRVQDYFEGSRVSFADVAVDAGEQGALYAGIRAAVRAIPWGETATYGAIARRFGDAPELPRIVGQAMARNPVPLIIPCHRVLAAGGRVGGFSAPGGADAKLRMLALEGVQAGTIDRAQATFAF